MTGRDGRHASSRLQHAHRVDAHAGTQRRAVVVFASVAVAAVAAVAVLGVGRGVAKDPPLADAAQVTPAAPTDSRLDIGPVAAADIPAGTRPDQAPPSSRSPVEPSVSAGPFPGSLLIADRGNRRLLIVNDAGRVVWRFPVAGSLPRGQRFAADDAFISPDGRTIVSNEEEHQVIVRIDITSRKVIWEYGRYNVKGSTGGRLHTPDDAYPLANGDITVADIENCRILEIAPSKRIVKAWGQAGRCVGHPPATYGRPNGDTPLPDGGMLITQIVRSRVVRLSQTGRVIFDIHVPTRYPSDAQLDPQGNIIVVDYSNPGAILRLDRHGRVLWRYGPRSGRGRLDHPSLAVALASGLIVVNDDFRHRILVIDPRTNKIVWQYGRTDIPGLGAGRLNVPDGLDPLPPGIGL